MKKTILVLLVAAFIGCSKTSEKPSGNLQPGISYRVGTQPVSFTSDRSKVLIQPGLTYIQAARTGENALDLPVLTADLQPGAYESQTAVLTYTGVAYYVIPGKDPVKVQIASVSDGVVQGSFTGIFFKYKDISNTGAGYDSVIVTGGSINKVSIY